MSKAVELSNELLDFLLQKKEEKPELKFWLRQRNKNNRLESGYWFQGDDSYISIGFTSVSSGNRSTQSISFIVWLKNDQTPHAKIEILYKDNPNKKYVDCYQEIVSRIDGFNKLGENNYQYFYQSNDILHNLNEFIEVQLPIIEQIIREKGLENELLISQDKFEKILKNTLLLYNALLEKSKLNILIVNLTWNSKDWKEISDDTSDHKWVQGGNVPNESWNFDFENKRNNQTEILGFAQFTKPPNIKGNNNLIIFYSKGKIVGFYGKTEVLKVPVLLSELESYNLVAAKDFSLVLENKIDNIKDKGYLESKERVGQIGFAYLENTQTAINIIEEAIKLNPNNHNKLENIKNWLLGNKTTNKVNYWVFQGSPDIYDLVKSLKAGHLKTWKVSAHKDKISIGDKVIIWQTGESAGCYALADVISDVSTFEEEIFEKYYYKNQSDTNITDRVKIHVSHYLNENPILWKNIKDNPILSGLNVGNRGTNFTATKEQYQAIVALINQPKNVSSNNMKASLNKILFGPPGTGKTFSTINEAIKIADSNFYNLHKGDRAKLKERFKLLQINEKEEGQIAFVTFHQSFSYEDFVEGIKPVEPKEDDTYLKYEIKEGIFKKLCRLASDSLTMVEYKKDDKISLTESEFEKAQFYKLSLGNTALQEGVEVFNYCVENNCIAIGFGDGLDLSGLDEKAMQKFGKENGFERFPIQALNYFKNNLKLNDYVIVSNGNNYVRAIGKVLGDYEFIEESPISGSTYNHFRKVEWLYTGKNIPIKELFNRILSQQTIYRFDKKEIVKEFFVKGSQKIETDLPQNPKNFVLVIDEINRGNVSSIFGELITLIEPDKRAGNDEELRVILPYSKETFSVPPNLYIVGTMNTADRSIEALDTALRRRFSFKEMPPKPELILTDSKLVESNGFIEDIDVKAILDTINLRIEKLINKDHKIGHSYFLNIKNEKELITAFKNKVIPLLEEYFFGDYGKIGLILGNSFVSKDEQFNDFAKFVDYDEGIVEDLRDRAVYKIKDENLWDFKSIYE